MLGEVSYDARGDTGTICRLRDMSIDEAQLRDLAPRGVRWKTAPVLMDDHASTANLAGHRRLAHGVTFSGVIEVRQGGIRSPQVGHVQP